MEEITIKFRLRLNSEKRGKYKKGDEDDFYIKLLDEQCGLCRFPIDKHWDIVGYKIEKD